MPHHTSRPRPLALTLAVAFALAAQFGPESARAEEQVPQLESSSMLSEPSGGFDQDASVASADSIEGSPETELIMRGDAEIRRGGIVIKGDKLTYTQATDIVQAEGNASISQGGATVEAPQMWYHLSDKTGQANHAEYSYAPNRMRGEADSVEFEQTGNTAFSHATCTTCRKGDNSWWLEFDSLIYDSYEQEGTGRNATLKLGGVPVLGTPWFTFPMTNQRKSGFLAPSFGVSSSRGVDVSVPYYFNIAPNYDYTFTPRVMSKRGILLGNEFRLKQEAFEGELSVDFLPNDSMTDEKRYGIKGNLKGSWNHFGYGIDYNRVSDDDFLDDFSGTIDESTDNVIAQNYWLTYGTTYWNASVRVEKNQTINHLAEIYKPYEREPQFTWNAYVADLNGFELTTKLEATRFVHPTQLNGDRFVAHQQISYPIQSAGWFVVPKAQFIGTWYDLDKAYNGSGEKSPSVTVPIFSLDAGLIFERELNLFSRDMTQTLEPRLFYSYIPHRNQSDIPIFDSSIADASFGQIFSENSWTGYDRIEENNSLTAAITTRFIDEASGVERFRAAIGQRYYFSDDKLAWNGTTEERDDQKSDLLASVGAQLTRAMQANAFVQWSPERERSQRLSAGVRWQPRPMSVLGLYYRYNWNQDPESDNFIKQIDLQAQWPITSDVSLLARQNYSLHDHKFIENLVGLEYRADCWTVRMVAQRYTRNTGKSETNYYLQLELNGLGSIGSSPLSALEESIQGYQYRKPTPTQIGTYDYYQ